MDHNMPNPQPQAAAGFIEKVKSWAKPVAIADLTVQDVLDMLAEGWLKPDDVIIPGSQP